MQNKKILQKILFSMVLIISVFCFNANIYAKTMSKDDVPGSAYIIGTHMFTRNTNEAKGYEGKLTTNLIMLASKTIDSGNMNDMIIYYKTATGNWINGLTGSEITPPISFKINYTNESLEENNDTVSAPKKPIIFFDTALRYDKDDGNFSAVVWIYLDDINDKTNKIDGVEVKTIEDGVLKNYDLTYDEYFKSSVTTFTNGFTGNVEGITVGNSYHTYGLDIEDIDVSQTYHFNVQTYVLDENGKKVYSDTLVDNLTTEDFLPVVKVKSSYSNPSYVSKEDGYYNYQLEIEKPEGWPNSSLNLDSYAYVLYEETDNGNRQVGIFGLNEKVMVTVPENKVVRYKAVIGYYNKQSNFIVHSTPSYEDKILTIDTRKLTTPILSIYDWSWEDRMRDGERIQINNTFYTSQLDDTLDYNKEGIEFYEIVYKNSQKTYRLLSNSSFNFTDFLPSNGHALYVARVYATNAVGEKVYSDLSNVVEVVRTPNIQVSDVGGGTATISIANANEYGTYSTVQYKVYDENDQEIKSVNSIKDSTTVDTNTKIYVRAYDSFDQELVYSSKSNVIDIDLD